MNDNEFADILTRERRSRSAGWTTNDYTCKLCLSEDKTEMNSTYLDWPMYFLGQQPICDQHAEFIFSRQASKTLTGPIPRS